MTLQISTPKVCYPALFLRFLFPSILGFVRFSEGSQVFGGPCLLGRGVLEVLQYEMVSAFTSTPHDPWPSSSQQVDNAAVAQVSKNMETTLAAFQNVLLSSEKYFNVTLRLKPMSLFSCRDTLEPDALLTYLIMLEPITGPLAT